MAIFEPITLEWNGKPYVIPPDKVLRAIAIAEDTLPLGALHRAMASGKLPLAKLAISFGALLRFAGAAVTDEEVYDALFKGKAAELQKRALNALHVLNVLMIPPEHLQADPKSAKTRAAGRRAASSRKPTSSQSAKAG